jgi:DNA processing protein
VEATGGGTQPDGVAAPLRLTPDDPAFPSAALRARPQPTQLFAHGDLALLQRPAVAIVGSRQPSPYGVHVAFEAARALAEAGVVVVSGAAKGLDARAHQGALAAGGGTIAVLGCGIDVTYPVENAALLAEIRAKGLVLTELPAGTHPAPWTFPMRNRLICALARALLVVEGRARGGTSNSVEWAVKVETPIFAVPGRITDDVAEGPNLLIQQGAHPYLGPADLLDFLQVAHRATPKVAPLAEATHAARAELHGAEATLYDLITTQPVHVDHLSARSALDPGLALAALSSLELQGLIRQLPGKHFVLAA